MYKYDIIASFKDSLVCSIKKYLDNNKFKFIEDLFYFEDCLYISKELMQLCIL